MFSSRFWAVTVISSRILGFSSAVAGGLGRRRLGLRLLRGLLGERRSDGGQQASAAPARRTTDSDRAS